MPPKSFRFGIPLLLLILVLSKFASNAYLTLEEFRICDPNRNYPIKIWHEVKVVKNKQVASGNTSLPFPLGDNMKSVCKIEVLRGGVYKNLLTVTENNACTAMNKYLGEFWHKIQRKVNTAIPVGSCPIPKVVTKSDSNGNTKFFKCFKGVYHLYNFPLEFETLTVKSFPSGKIRVTEKLFDAKTNEETICFIITLKSQ